MKKVVFFFIVLTSFLYAYSQEIINIAYVKSQSDILIKSNEVTTQVVGTGEIRFYEHPENIKDQYLDSTNTIKNIGELDLTSKDSANVYFKENMFANFYPTKFEFFIQEEGSEKIEKIENNSDTPNITKEINLIGGKKYKITFVGSNLKNTPNLDKGDFSIEAYSKENKLGEVRNTLHIVNDIIFKEDENNVKIQYLNYKNQISVIGDISFKNILQEPVQFKLNFDSGFYPDVVEGKIGSQIIKFYRNISDNSFYSDSIVLSEDETIEVYGFGINNTGNLKSGKFTLSALVNNINYGSITNTLIMENGNQILLEKTTEQRVIKIGDLLKYKLKIKITDSNRYEKIYVEDYLPRGFEIIEKSIKSSKGAVENIKTEVKNKISFNVLINNYINVNELDIEYIVKINVTSKSGKNTNRAIVQGINEVNTTQSNMASVTIDLDKENFSDKGVIVGLVYLNLDDKLEYNSKIDIPIPGVTVFLENGDFAITDENGKYSIYGISALTHIAKIDYGTLPKGIKGIKLSPKYSKNGNSQYIDLKKAQLFNSNFAYKIEDLTLQNEIVSELEKRRDIFKEKLTQELMYEIDNNELDFETTSSDNSTVTLGERGTINNIEHIDMGKELVALPENQEDLSQVSVGETDLRKQINNLSAEELTEQIEAMKNTLDIINVKDGDVVLKQMTFQITSPLNGSVDLFVDDKKVDLGHIGLRASSSQNDLFFLEYVAVNLKEGKNKIRASFFDMFGIERGRVVKTVLVRGTLNKIIFEKNGDIQISDSETVKFSVKGTDSNDIPMEHMLNATATVDEKFGEWVTMDSDPVVPGLQFMVPGNSEKVLEFRAKPGKKNIKFKLQVEHIENEFEIEVLGKTKEMFVNGIVEGRFNFNKSLDSNFFFENKINNLYNNQLYYRGAVFAEGHVNDDYYMTMTYDSAKEKEKFFGYKNPDDYYPIFGDNSIKGYIGESREDLYIKVEKDESYIMYGDYRTEDLFYSRLRLNQYSRTLTGISSIVSKEKYTFNSFVAKTSSLKVKDKFQGQGISGPYTLSNRDILEGSETVKLVTYDRRNGSFLEEKVLRNGVDYTIEYDLGRIYFADPVMAYDTDFNPIFIEINFEIENESGKKHYIYGAHTMYDINKNMAVGLSYIKDDDKVESYEMSGSLFLYEKENHLLILEESKTNDYEEGEGKAYSLYYKYETENTDLKLVYEKSDEDYFNPDSKVRSGIENFKLEGEYKLENNNILKFQSEILKEKTDEQNYNKKDIYLGMEFAKKSNFIYEIGAKHYFKNDTSDQESLNTIGGSITWEPEEYNFFRAFLEYEQDILLSEKRRFAGGIDYDVTEDTTFYIRREFISELGDDYYLDPEDDSNKTLIGIKTKKYFGSEIFTEYREVNDDTFVRPEIGSGIKRDYEVNESLKLYGTFERIDPVQSQTVKEENKRKSETAITVGYDYQIDLTSKSRGEFEIKTGDETSFLNKLSYAKQLSESLYFITKNRYYTMGDVELQDRFILGIAYRDANNNKYNSLNKYEINYSKNMIEENYKQFTNLIRSSHNYEFTESFDGTLTLGVKNTNTTYDDISSDYTAFLLASNLNKNISDKWTTGVNISTIFDSESNMDYGLGVEVGYVFDSSLWLSVGYNFVGFNDKDFDPSGELTQGLYFRFRMNVGDIFEKK